MSIQDRKKDHVRLCLDNQSAYQKSAGFDKWDLDHNALPEIDFTDISTEARLLGRTFSFPLFISSMTGGYSGAVAVNTVLASFCEKNNIPLGVGSQRAMLEYPEQTESFSVVRQHAPSAYIAANIGGSQLALGLSDKKVRLLIDSIEANAVIVHLNPLQELMQPEGDVTFRGILEGIEDLVNRAGVPVIVKETGAGISGKVALRLYEHGVRVIDTAGAGGTSWSRVENARKKEDAHHLFNEWGIPTAECIEEIAGLKLENLEIIASGGIRSGVDMVKAFCLGAQFAASAQPVIQAVSDGGEDELQAQFDRWKKELKIALCLLGAAEISQLNRDMLRSVSS